MIKSQSLSKIRLVSEAWQSGTTRTTDVSSLGVFNRSAVSGGVQS